MRCRGWSLKEMLIVLASVVALSGLLIPLALRIRIEAKRTACQSRIASLGAAIMEDYWRTGMFPDLHAISRRTGVSCFCPIDGRQYTYPVGFVPLGAAEKYDQNALRHDWNRLVSKLAQKKPHYPILYCSRCYDPKLAASIVRWANDGIYWNPVFTEDVGLKSRYFGINMQGKLGYYNPHAFNALLWRLWHSRFMQHPIEQMGGVLPSDEELRVLEEQILRGGV